MSNEPLEILLIEDNTGDARLVREMIDSIAPMDGRFDRDVDVGPDRVRTDGTGTETPDSAPVEPSLHHVDNLSAGIDEAGQGAVDIVLLDLNLPDSQGLDTLDTMLEAAPTIPIVVLTGLQDRTMGLEALDHGAQEYLVKDEINADLLIRTVFHAIQRAEYERLIERQHERLSTLYDISVTAQDIAGSLIDYSTRDEIESNVCERLAASEVYQYAWIGTIDRDSGPLTPRSASVPSGFLDRLSPSLGDSKTKGPVAEAALTQETQFIQAAVEDRVPDHVRDHASAFGYQSVAAIPISYEGAMYGVLALYSERLNAYETEEVEILTQLGNVLGHSIAAVERKAALMNDAAVELDLYVPDFVGAVPEEDGEIEFLTTLPAGDGEYLQYATVSALAEDHLTEVLEQFPEYQDVRVVDDATDRHLVEISYDGPPVVSTLARFGGHIRSASLADGDYHVTVDLPTDVDVRSFVESVRESTPDIDLIAQRSVESNPASGLAGPSIRDAALTEKQHQAIEAAYFAGYFEQPRQSTGEEIAESLDITASTFHQHLQAGLRNLLAAEFEENGQPEPSPG